MSLRLRLASAWLPRWAVRRELERVGAATTAALDRLLAEHTARGLGVVAERRSPSSVPLDEQRAAMAWAHTARVTRLVEILGRDAAVGVARRVLFETGVGLGARVRRRLGVKETPRDLVRAARLLYRVLGIRFAAEWTSQDEALVRIERCALARGYSPEACRALSAADEGVVAGLWPGASLEFEARITEGHGMCLARLRLPKAEEERR